MRSTRSTMPRSISCWISSSRTTWPMPPSTSAAVSATRPLWRGSHSHWPTRCATSSERTRWAITSSLKKLVCTKRPSVWPSRSLRRGMIAVCGMGRPSGWRNKAVTANQSASAPTIAASANAATKPTNTLRSANGVAAKKITATAASSPVAMRFIRVSSACRSASAGERVGGVCMKAMPGHQKEHDGYYTPPCPSCVEESLAAANGAALPLALGHHAAAAHRCAKHQPRRHQHQVLDDVLAFERGRVREARKRFRRKEQDRQHRANHLRK